MSTPARIATDWDAVGDGIVPSLVTLSLGRGERVTTHRAVAMAPFAVATSAAAFVHHATWTERSLATLRHAGESWPAELNGYRLGWDLAVYGSERPVPPASVRWSRTVPVGETIAAIGLGPEGPTVAAGRVVARERAVNNARPYERSFLVAGVFAPAAHEGDAVVDVDGRLLGIVTVAPAAGPAVVAPAERALAFATIGLLIFMVESRRSRDALLHFEERVRATGDWRGFCEAGIVHESRDRFEEALDVWREASALEPDNAWIHDAIARSCERLGRDAEAGEARRRARALEPDARGQRA